MDSRWLLRVASRRRFAARARVWVLAGSFLAAAGSAASPARAEDPAEQRAQSFQAVEGAVQEDVPGGPLLVAAYGAILALLLLYVIRIVRLQQRAQGDIDRLEQALTRTPPRQGSE